MACIGVARHRTHRVDMERTHRTHGGRHSGPHGHTGVDIAVPYTVMFFCIFKNLQKMKNVDRVFENGAHMQVKLLFLRCPQKHKNKSNTKKTSKTRKFSSHAGKTLFSKNTTNWKTHSGQSGAHRGLGPLCGTPCVLWGSSCASVCPVVIDIWAGSY